MGFAGEDCECEIGDYEDAEEAQGDTFGKERDVGEECDGEGYDFDVEAYRAEEGSESEWFEVLSERHGVLA